MTAGRHGHLNVGFHALLLTHSRRHSFGWTSRLEESRRVGDCSFCLLPPPVALPLRRLVGLRAEATWEHDGGEQDLSSWSNFMLIVAKSEIILFCRFCILFSLLAWRGCGLLLGQRC